MFAKKIPDNNIRRSTSQGKLSRISRSSQKKLCQAGKQNRVITSQKPNRLPQKLKLQTKTTEDRNSLHIRSINAVSENKVDAGSLQDMIELLKQYQKGCLQKEDFSSAEQAKNKIDFLKTQQLVIRKEELESKEKQNIQRISKEGETEIKKFQENWDEQLQELIEALKEVESNLTEQHEKQLEEIHEKLAGEQPPKVKFSSQVLQMRRHLSNLIKVKNYKQAQNVKQNLEIRQRQQSQKWDEKFEQKKHHKIETVMKKQENQLKALRIRLQGVFNEKLKERDQKFEILLKKNRKRRIESGKMSRQKLRTKTVIMNESKSMMQSTIGVIGNCIYKF